ncbi:MAG: hypothetical protein GEU87_16990 [Alphaproteobacteria bacterium]|nr:hypothetical protein [Alphaproteobacteria bacterium]
MLRYVLLLLVANAVFAPATALTVDQWNGLEHGVLELAAGDSAPLSLPQMSGAVGAATGVNTAALTQVPLPPTVWLFVAALATGLALIRRRQPAAG